MDKDWRNQASFLDKVQHLVTMNDKLGDVVFVVGPEKTKIKSFSFILIASSSVFESMLVTEPRCKRERTLTEEECVLLPDVQPKVFRHFLRLLHQEDVDVEYLKKLELTLEEVLHFLHISKQFAVKKLIQVSREYLLNATMTPHAVMMYETLQSQGSNEPELEKAAWLYIKTNINALVDLQEFVLISKTTLTKILREQSLVIDELKLFEAVYRWGEFECETLGLEKTGGNVRDVLGHLLFLIRFPLISPRNFTLSVRTKHVLKKDEALAIYSYTTISNEDRVNFNTEELPFSTMPRSPKIETVTFFNGRDNPQFICNPKVTYSNSICCDHRIAIYAFGFLGPIDRDSDYVISITIKKAGDVIVGQTMCRIAAKKGQSFFAEFDAPVILEASLPYWIDYITDGERTQSTVSEFAHPVEKTAQNGVRFVYCCHNNVSQMNEIRFARI